MTLDLETQLDRALDKAFPATKRSKPLSILLRGKPFRVVGMLPVTIPQTQRLLGEGFDGALYLLKRKGAPAGVAGIICVRSNSAATRGTYFAFDGTIVVISPKDI